MPLKNLSKHYCLLGLLSILVLGLIVYGAQGVRGSDQYWYVADVEKIVEGDPLVTNNYFPGVILRGGAVPDENYIMHNGPMLHMVALLASPDNVYKSWIYLNTVFHFIVAICIFFLSLKFSSEVVATVVTALYLVSPVSIWQTINPLLEMYFSMLVALQLLCFYHREKIMFRYLLYPLALLGVLSHPIFIFPAVLWGVFAATEKVNFRTTLKLIEFFLFFLFFFIVMKFGEIWFPSSFQPDLKAIIGSAVPKKSNMFWHYAETIPPITIDLMIAKIQAALYAQVFKIQYAPMYIFTNLGVISAIFLALFHLKAWWKVLIPLALFGSQYFAIILLQQNHPRFQQIVAVVSFLCIAAALKELGADSWSRDKRVLRGTIFGGFCLLLCVAFMTNISHNEGVFERKQLRELQHQLHLIPVESRLVGLDIKPHSPFSYVVRPRKMLFIRSDMLADPSIDRAVELFKPDYVISHGDRALDNVVQVAAWDNLMFGRLVLYRMNGSTGYPKMSRH